MAQLWKGRFKKELAKETNDFNSSISFDCRMFEEDIKGSIAHATMLGATGIIDKNESDKIIAELDHILSDIKNGSLTIDMEAEDIHTFVEGELTARLGQTGKRLHTARSRNDQVALDIRLTLRKEIEEIEEKIKELIEVICTKAEENKQTIMPGYTHLQRAQPITFAHHIMAYAAMLCRDLSRLSDVKSRMNICPLGSGALAGTTYPLNRAQTAELLGFDGVTLNSLDGVSDRDFCIELAAALSIIMVHLSRFSEEIIMWCSWEFKFVELDDAFSTGSSIMPQKKNPDIAELVRGKSGRVFGDLTTLLTVMKGIALAYNKDMQEDKEAIFDAVDTVKMCLTAFTPMIAIIGVKAVRHILTVSTASKIASLSSCISLLYARAIPFITVKSVVKSPNTRPLFPLTSSAISGFFFCGIMDEPVEKASSSSTNLNSQLHHIMISSENLERCTIIIESAAASSMQKSRSETPSSELSVTPSNPRSSAVCALLSG